MQAAQPSTEYTILLGVAANDKYIVSKWTKKIMYKNKLGKIMRASTNLEYTIFKKK